MNRRSVLKRCGEWLAALGVLPGLASHDLQFFTDYDLVLNDLRCVQRNVSLTLCDRDGSLYQIVANQWDGQMLNGNFYAGPIFYEYLHDDPLYRSPWTAHPERIAYQPLTQMASTGEKDGTFACLPTGQGTGIFIISSPL